MLIVADRMLHPDGSLEPGWVHVVDERVAASGAGPALIRRAVDHHVDLLTPGFIDLHCHGGGGASFGTHTPAAQQVLATHRAHGVTTTLASLVSAPLPDLREQVQALAPLVASGDLAGIHLEGPWLDPTHRGAHDSQALGLPTPEAVDEVLTWSDVRVVTLAPELPGALEAIRRLTDAGVVAAIGHTGATAEQTAQAIDAGARLATHLFNAMPGIHHRNPGPVPVCLADGRVVVELIADGVHLSAPVLAMAAGAAKGGAALVTDAMAAAGAPDGDYDLGSLAVRVKDGRAVLRGTDTVAGSTSTLDAALRAAVAAGIPLEQALTAVTTTPARVLGRSDLATLAPDSVADLVIMDADLQVNGVMRRGEWVTPPTER